jgi:acyl-CoA reductase-like NAD-dependent aldehyde dehydrogenase
MTPALALQSLREAEARDGALPIPRRRALLAALAEGVLAQAAEIAAALDADYGGAGRADGGPPGAAPGAAHGGGRSRTDTLLADVVLVADGARHARRKLHGWARPRRVGVPYPFLPALAWEVPEPKGIIGIMAPWNYPVQLALMPAVDALAAGNRIAIKPSEATPRTAALLAEMLPRVLGADIAAVVLGGPDVAADFAAQRWDHLVFTGGTETGRKVALAAAANLVPVTLELGGKCPVVVAAGADLAKAARNILVAKAVNAGQTCIAPDTVLLVGHRFDAFFAACRATGIALPESALASDAQAARLDSLLAGAEAIPLGPDGPGRRRALALARVAPGSALERTEIFGPVLGVLELPDMDAASAWIRRGAPPLAIYLFGGTRAEAAALSARTRSGAVVRNRAVEYAAFPDLGFGGVGASGQGHTHGWQGFRNLSHFRAHVWHGGWSLSRLFDLPRKSFAERLIARLARLR